MNNEVKIASEEGADRNLLSLAAELGLENISNRINAGLEGHPVPASWRKEPTQQEKPFSQLT